MDEQAKDQPEVGSEGATVEAPQVDVVRVILDSLYSSAVSSTIRLPDEHGAFPSAQWPMNWFPIPPLVADANVLRNDILYACKHDQRTSLVTGTNAGVLRLFCASHVPQEVERHAPRWAKEGGVELDGFLDRWRREYLPLLRCVEVPYELLTALEWQWLETLERADPDDVPSAALARLLGAFYLSEDGPALRAVYGPDVDTKRHHGWLLAIRSGSDSAHLGGVVNTAFIFPAILGQGVYHAGKRLYETSPWLLGGVVVATGVGGYFLWKSKSERVQRAQSGAWSFVEYVFDVGGQLAAYMSECEVVFSVMFPSVPGWEDLRTSHHGEDVLARHCLHELARDPGGSVSAVEMQEKLPFHITGQEKTVRKVFREYECFEQVGRGRWQVGKEWTVPAKAQVITARSVLQPPDSQVPSEAQRKEGQPMPTTYSPGDEVPRDGTVECTQFNGVRDNVKKGTHFAPCDHWGQHNGKGCTWQYV